MVTVRNRRHVFSRRLMYLPNSARFVAYCSLHSIEAAKILCIHCPFSQCSTGSGLGKDEAEQIDNSAKVGFLRQRALGFPPPL